MSYRRRFNLDEVLREWAAEQVATNRDQRDTRRGGEDAVASADGAAEEDEVRQQRAPHKHHNSGVKTARYSKDQCVIIGQIHFTK